MWLTWVAAICTRLSRCRNSDRTAQTSCSGRYDARKSPTECKNCNHWQSDTSVRRPGTFFTWRALTRHTSKPRSSKTWNSGIQYTLVDSMATVFTPHCLSQSAKAYRSCVKLGNERTFSAARSHGTAKKISVAPISIPAASGRITGNMALFALVSFLRFLAIVFSFCQQTTARVAQNGHSSNRDRRQPKPRASERHHCIEHETRNQASYRA